MHAINITLVNLYILLYRHFSLAGSGPSQYHISYHMLSHGFIL